MDCPALEAHGGQQWTRARGDKLEDAVLPCFEQRIFGPMRLDRLARQPKADARSKRRSGRLAGNRIRQQVAELDRKIKAHVVVLEEGIEPELASERIGERRAQ